MDCCAPERGVPPEEMGKPDAGVKSDAYTGDILGDYGGLRGPGHPPVQPRHKPEVQDDIQPRREGQKDQRRHRVAQRAQERGKKVVEENGSHAGKDHREIRPHRLHQSGGRLEGPDDPVQSQHDGEIQQDGDGGQEQERGRDPLPEAPLITLAEAQGKDRAAPHRQPQQNGSEEGHQRKGRPHGRQGVLPQKTAHNQRIGNVIALLQQIAQNHGQGKAQHGFHHGALGQIPLHLTHLNFRLKVSDVL